MRGRHGYLHPPNVCKPRKVLSDKVIEDAGTSSSEFSDDNLEEDCACNASGPTEHLVWAQMRATNVRSVLGQPESLGQLIQI